MIEISYSPALEKKFDERLIKSTILTALENQAAPKDATLSILLTDDEQIRSLNRDYRGFDAPTDVLSFEVHERDPETGSLYLGEIIVSMPYAAKQALQNDHPLEAEIQLLVVHGILHLLGHDHAENEEKTIMWAAQAKILSKLGLSNIKITES
ncbi:MAG: rRNA maturation RNase YbeY [Anaerolineae bacterium]|jgi:probable rRNA maturation factor|nr:rRNA maturation RNase YbeY [Anaerolineae bacterium]MBT7191012.1 rRNA maturation RNase YbeY [Anaerolineae bacterium]